MVENAVTAYEAVIASRDRLAGLPPVTQSDVDAAAEALQQVTWLLLSDPPAGPAGARLNRAVRNQDGHSIAMAVALLAAKLGPKATAARQADAQLSAIRDALDVLTFDHRMPKRDVLAVLRALKADIDTRTAYVSKYRQSGYKFQSMPERYANRKDKRERPDAFFARVYAAHVKRGLTQADVRRIDPAYYNVLHVWCSRNKRRIANFLPPGRASRR